MTKELTSSLLCLPSLTSKLIDSMYSILAYPKMQSAVAKRLVMILIGMTYPLGFSPFDIWPLTAVSLLLLINEIVAHLENELDDENISKEGISRNKGQSSEAGKKHQWTLFSLGLYWALGAFGLGTSWVYVSIHEFGHTPMLGAAGLSFVFVLALAVFKASGIYLIGKMDRLLGKSMLVLIVPFVWVASEFIQTLLFPWLFAGYTQIDGPLRMLSTWLGVYGVSWFMLAISSCLVILFRLYMKKDVIPQKRLIFSPYSFILLILISIPLLSTIVSQPTIVPAKQSIKVALVQPDIDQGIKWSRQYFSQIIDILYQQSSEHWDADLLVWPEGAIPAYRHQVEDIIGDLNRRSKSTQTDLLLGLPVYQKQQEISYSAFISLGEYPQTYHKQVLVPFGEYLPLGNLLRGLIDFFNLPMSDFSPATTKQQAMNFKDYQVIPAICYEITYPGIVHDLIADADVSSDKAKLLVTVSNDAWFGDSFGPYQHMQMARMRALELGIPLVRSTNDGVTAVVDARGNLLEKLDRNTQDTLTYEVSLISHKTPYRRFGLLGIYLILAVNSVVFLRQWWSKKRADD